MSAFLNAIQKAGFDPNQPRNERGRWTDTGQYVGDVPKGGFYAELGEGELLTDFKAQAKQYPKTGPKGIGYFKGVLDKRTHVDCLLYRAKKDGPILGILNHYPVDIGPEQAGNVNVLVSPTATRQGIGSALMREAGRRWNIDLGQQTYTPSGAALANAMVRQPVKVKKSWLGVVKEAVWNEADHPRGKTTPESNAGSFAAANKEISLKQFRTMRGEITIEKPVFNHDEQEPDIEEVQVLLNPTGEELLRWAGREVEEFRYIRFPNGASLWWNADDARHRTVMRVMQGMGYKFTWEDVSSFGESTPQLLRRDMMRKSWMSIVKDYVWNEAYHARGKTTPESNSGSFAPMLSGQQSLTIESYEYKRPGVRHQTKIDVIFNPDRAALKRWAGRDVKMTRWLQWGDNVVVWNSYDALHQQVANALVKAKKAKEADFEDAYWNGNNFDNGPTVRTGDTAVADMLTDLFNDVVPVKKSWLGTITDSLFKWDEEKHPRGKTSQESTPGSFTSSLRPELVVSPQLDGKPWGKQRVRIMVNPSKEKLIAVIRDEGLEWNQDEEDLGHFRYLRSKSGNLFVWPASEQAHFPVAEALERTEKQRFSYTNRDGGYLNYRDGELYATFYVGEDGGSVEFPYRGKKTVLKWDEADHPRGKTTPESNAGSFAPKEIPGQNVDMKNAGMVIVEADKGASLRYMEYLKKAKESRRYVEIDRVQLQEWRDAAERTHTRFLDAWDALEKKLDLAADSVFENAEELRNYAAIRATVPSLNDLYGWQVETVLSASALSYRHDPRFEAAFDEVFTQVHSLSNALGMEVNVEDTIAKNLEGAIYYEQEAEKTKALFDLVSSPDIEPESIEALRQTLPGMETYAEDSIAMELRRQHAYGDTKLETDNPKAAKALDSYIGPGYDEINDQFRTGGDPLTSDSPGSAIKQHPAYTAVHQAAYDNYVKENLSWHISVATDKLWLEQHPGGRLDASLRELAQFREDNMEALRATALKTIHTEADEAAFLRAHVILTSGNDEAVDAEWLRRQIKAWKDAKEIVRLIDSRPPTDEPMVLYRGVKTGASIKLTELKPGDEFITSGFYSTSASRDKAYGWAGKERGKLLEIHVPKGSRDVLFTTNDGENEVLLNHGVRLEYIGTRLRLIGDTQPTLSYVFTFLGQDQDTGRVGRPIRKKAGGKKYRVNFGRFQTEPTIVDELAKRDTDGTQPRDERGRWAETGEFKLTFHRWGGFDKPRGEKATTTVLKNPSVEALLRFAGRDVIYVRAVHDAERGDLYVWDAREALHVSIEDALIEQEISSRALSRPGTVFGLDTEYRVSVLADEIRQGKWAKLQKWDEEDHPRGKTTPESNSGSFAPAYWAQHRQTIADLVSNAGSLTAEGVKAGRHPLLSYRENFYGSSDVLGQYQPGPDKFTPGTVTLSASYFADSDPLGRSLLLSHEFGHAIQDYLSWTGRWPEAMEAFEGFRTGGAGITARFDNPVGLSSRPEEMMADVYSALLISKTQPWEDDEGRYGKMYRYVLRVASEMGLPLPAWHGHMRKWDEADHPRGETTEGTNKGSFAPRNMGFVSPNIDENVDFQEAANRVTSHRTKLLMQADDEISVMYGTKVHQTVGVGAWADGAEQSVIMDGPGDPEAFKAHASLSGLLAEQKAVLCFTNDDKGPDSLYRLSVGNRPLKEVHSILLESGVQFHTLRKTDHNVDVFVFGEGSSQELVDALNKAADRFGVDDIPAIRGYGEFIGSWDSREEGRKAYEGVLDAYEKSHPVRDGGWQELRNRWLPRLQAVRKSWLQEVTKAAKTAKPIPTSWLGGIPRP